MALRLRRGTDAERLLVTPLQGELVYATDTKKIYVGDGAVAGGVLIGPTDADAFTSVISEILMATTLQVQVVLVLQAAYMLLVILHPMAVLD